VVVEPPLDRLEVSLEVVVRLVAVGTPIQLHRHLLELERVIHSADRCSQVCTRPTPTLWNYLIPKQLSKSKSCDNHSACRASTRGRPVLKCKFEHHRYFGTTTGQGLFGNTTGANAGGGAAGGTHQPDLTKCNLIGLSPFSISAPMFGFPKPAASGASFASALGGSTNTGSGLSGGGLFSGAVESWCYLAVRRQRSLACLPAQILSEGVSFGNIKPADGAAKPATSSCEHELMRNR
jgi:hypothetical protein